MRPRLALALIAALAAVLLTAPLPVLDEESYLAISSQFSPERPYDWWRPWPPWNGNREADAFVYAHPPLFLVWVWIWSRGQFLDPGVVHGLKIALALPWAALLGWSVGYLAERYTRRPWMSIAGWIATPITLLGLQRGLMPDLMLTSLSALAVVCWLEGHRRSRKEPVVGWWVIGGIALALAVLTKYPAIVLVPALLYHGRALDRLSASRYFWGAFAVVWLGVELWLWSIYGRFHLWEVLSRSDEIPSGTMGGRALGTMTRLSLGTTALFLLPHATRKGAIVLGAVTIAVTVWGLDGNAPFHWIIPMAVMAGLGVVMLAMLAMEAFESSGDEDRIDLLLGTWGLCIAAGVVFGHNFSAPRYLLPLMVPVAIVGARVAERIPETRRIWWFGVILQGGLGLTVSWGEHAFARGADAAAHQVAEAFPEGGVFTGEWTFRWRMEQYGWTFYTEGILEEMDRDWVAVPVHSSPTELPTNMGAVERFVSDIESGIRVVCAPSGVGLYGETIGPLPVGWAPGVLEEVEVWRPR